MDFLKKLFVAIVMLLASHESQAMTAIARRFCSLRPVAARSYAAAMGFNSKRFTSSNENNEKEVANNNASWTDHLASNEDHLKKIKKDRERIESQSKNDDFDIDRRVAPIVASHELGKMILHMHREIREMHGALAYMETTLKIQPRLADSYDIGRLEARLAGIESSIARLNKGRKVAKTVRKK